MCFIYDPYMELFCPSKAKDYLTYQMDLKSINAVNKDRKILSDGWEWGKELMVRFPLGIPNPFKAMKEFPENIP